MDLSRLLMWMEREVSERVEPLGVQSVQEEESGLSDHELLKIIAGSMISLGLFLAVTLGIVLGKLSAIVEILKRK